MNTRTPTKNDVKSTTEEMMGKKQQLTKMKQFMNCIKTFIM